MKTEFANEAVEMVEVKDWPPTALLFGYQEANMHGIEEECVLLLLALIRSPPHLRILS